MRVCAFGWGVMSGLREGGRLTSKVIKVTYDTHAAIKPKISPYFFLLSYLRMLHTWHDRTSRWH